MAKRKRQRIYRANSHASFNDDDAAWIGEQLEIHGGDLSPKQLVDLARPRNSPGHKLFPWDDVEAAEAHRINVARSHLRMLKIEIVHEGEKQSIRACYPIFHADREAGSRRSHISYDNIREAPDLARQVVEGAAQQLLAWQRRYALYKNVFGSIFTAIEEMESELWPQQSKSTASRKTGTRVAPKIRQRKAPK